MVGLAMGFFADFPHISPEWRLLIVTGFLGGLTTFATFSAEAMGLLQKGDYVWALGHSLLHLIGSILFCFAGFATWRALTQ
jgi:CrcB protein